MLPDPGARFRLAEGDCFPKNPLEILIIIDVYFDINYVLGPGAGHCSDLVNHIKQFSVSGGLSLLVP